MKSGCSRSIFLLVLLVMAGAGAIAQDKHALVIGNGKYQMVTPLQNPVNDATDVAAALKSLGFTVELLTDASLPAMEDAVIRLGQRLSKSKGSYGFFYYAGHGVQSGGVNYLIPVDADIKSESYVKTKALVAQSVLDTLQDSSNFLNVVVLDACRNNPFGWSRAASRGLSVVGAQPPGSIIVYATSAGSTAADGAGRNGLFTTQLLKNLKTPGLEIKEVFNRTGADVLAASNNQQVPAVYNQFFKSAWLNGKGDAVAGSANPSPAPGSTAVIGKVSVTPGNVLISLAKAGKLDALGTMVDVPAGGNLPVDKLAPGEYRFSVRYPDGQVEERSVTVESGKTASLNFEGKATASSVVSNNVTNSIGQVLVAVTGGTFRMGNDRRTSANPAHDVTVSSFLIGQTEVTQGQYKAIKGKNPSKYTKGGDSMPVEQVSWYDAVDFCNRLSKKEGLTPAYTIKDQTVDLNIMANGYRLPTEAEWEFAARGGTFASGDTEIGGASNLEDAAWYYKNSGEKPHPVATKQANILGLYDMLGNVREWCQDIWVKRYPKEPQVDPIGTDDSFKYRVERGLDFNTSENWVKISERGGREAVYTKDNGFRVARSLR